MSADLLRMDDYLAKSLIRPALANGGGAATQALDPVVLASLDEAWDEGEADLVVELIDLYLGDAPQWVEAIRTAAAENDATVLKRVAHTLKGSSGSLGIRQVAEVCGMLELNCSESAARVNELLQLLVQEFNTARAALAAERLRRLA
ncbi:MAG TPA: Hpt domain-containing protein [Pyrinomonadaceae bacterium]|jgi:HPt (histidine-containing phosphotransfer) domain-containing protein|nr:Hpt domain-containing protein [Pyrinomonadaceae bacterium]